MNLFNDYKRKIHVLWVLAKTIISKHVSSMWNILGGVFLIDTLFRWRRLSPSQSDCQGWKSVTAAEVGRLICIGKHEHFNA